MKKICSIMILIGISSCYGSNQNKKFTYDSLKKEFIGSLKKIDDFHYSLGKLNYYLEDSLIDMTQQELPEDKELRKNNRNYKTKGKQIIENIQKYAAEAKENYKKRDGHWAPVSFIRGVDHAIGKHFPNLFDLVGKADCEEISTAIDIHRYIRENKDLSAIKQELLNIAKKKPDQIAAYGILGYLSIFKMIQDADGFMKHTYDHVISDKTIKSEFPTKDLGDVKPQQIKSTGIAFFINNVHYVSSYKSNILFIPIHNKFDLEKNLTLNTAIASIYTLDSFAELECKFNPGRKVQGFVMPEKQLKNEYWSAKISVEHAINGALKNPHKLSLPETVELHHDVEKKDEVQEIQLPNSVVSVKDLEYIEPKTDIDCAQDIFEPKGVAHYRTKYVNKHNGDISYHSMNYTPSMRFKTDKTTGMERVAAFVKLLESCNTKTRDSHPSKKYFASLIDTFSRIRNCGTDDLYLLCEIGCIATFFEANDKQDRFFEEYLSAVLLQDYQRIFIETISDDIIKILKEYPIVEQNLIDVGDSGINKMIKRQSKAYAKRYFEYFAEKYNSTVDYEVHKKNAAAINGFLEASARLRTVYNQIHDITRRYCRMSFAIGNMEAFMKESINSNMPIIHSQCKDIIDDLNKILAELKLNAYENACEKFRNIAKGNQLASAAFGSQMFYKNNATVRSSLKNVIDLLQAILTYKEYNSDLSEIIFITCRQIDVLFNAMFS